MLVVYRLATMVVEHCVHVSGPDYQTFLEADPERGFVEIEGSFRPDQIGIEVVDGAARAFVRDEFTFEVPATATAGVEIRITGVPNGTEVSGDGGALTMGKSGILDLTFDVAGSYELAFIHPRFVSMVRSIVVAA